MRSIARKLLSVAVAAVAMTLATTAGSADAAVITAPSAYNTRYQYIGSYPHAGLENAHVKRRIYLAAGTYTWRQTPNTSCQRGMTLGAGWYKWTDVLVPSGGYYTHNAYLDPDNYGWETAQLTCKWNPTTSATIHWGSTLLPHF